MTHRDTDITLNPIPEIIRPAVREGAGHGSAYALHVRRAAVDESGDSAHCALPLEVDVLVAAGAEESKLGARPCERAHAGKAQLLHESFGLCR